MGGERGSELACLSAECDRRALDTDDGDGEGDEEEEEEEEEALSRSRSTLSRAPPPPFPPVSFLPPPHSIRTVEAGYGALPPNDLGLPGSMEEEEVPAAAAAAVGDESARGPCLHCLVRAWIGLLARPRRCSFPVVLYCTKYRERNEAPPPFLLPCYCIPHAKKKRLSQFAEERGSSIHPRGIQIGKGVCL